MKRIGLTGNIGTGKSTIARIFSILGVPVYYADKQARLMLESDQVIKQITFLFGKHVLNPMHQLDRKALADIVFNDKDKLTILNNLIHPLVEEDFNLWAEFHKENNYILHEAAILFESGFDQLFDANILVTAPETLCIERVINRDKLTEEIVVERIRNQWPQDRKKELADYIITNDETSMVTPQVLAIHQKILNS
jgi:dephospho-CoA kinase